VTRLTLAGRASTTRPVGGGAPVST
jgi:hypothetical protein